MPDPPKISVIIPTFNCGAYVTDAVKSVLGQTAVAHEIIIIDDGSTDDTAERLRPLTRHVRYVRQANAGVAAARNHGLRLAAGDWIAFLDADDAWHPAKLAIQLATAAKQPDVGVLGTLTYDWPTPLPPRVNPTVDAPRIESVPRHRLLVRNCMTTSSVIVRNEVARTVGEFDTALQGPEDHDYWLRAAEVTGVANVALPLTGYRRAAPGSLSKQAVRMEAGMRRILQKLDDRDAWRGSRALRRRAYSQFHYSCAYMYGAAGEQRRAVGRVVRSIAWYPLPLRRQEAGAFLGRPRRLAVLALRMLRLAPPDNAGGDISNNRAA